MTHEKDTKLAPRRPVVLIILDGVGISPLPDNLLRLAHTPNLDVLFAKHPHALLSASGTSVGLPDNQMGNSEVGHMTLGAGSVIKQDLVLISDAIATGAFFDNEVLSETLLRCKQKIRPLHLLGLVSDGGVHSHNEHLIALIQLCHQQKVTPVLHMITDGRDTGPKTALKFLSQVQPVLKRAGGYVGSVGGRYFAMDRDQHWDRTERAWRAIVLAKGEKIETAEEAIQNAYFRGHSDEFIRPVVLPHHMPLDEHDEIFCFNFRKDRPRQIVRAIAAEDFPHFDRGSAPLPNVTCMMPYDRSLQLAAAFQPQVPPVCLGQVISQAGLEQFHCAETEKYAHVTYFFNAGRNAPFGGETQLLIPSPDVATYDMKPEMSAREVADAVIHAVNTRRYSFVVVNFANGDMVGHTANKHAILEALEFLDKQVRRVINAAERQQYSVLLTADHGNCETCVDPVTRAPFTQHTDNPVPFLLVDSENWRLITDGGLSNIAPTVLQLMGLPIPDGMRSKSLLLEVIPKEQSAHEMDGAA